MPAIRALGSRIHRHFSPLTVRTVFKPERFRTPSPIDFQMQYSVGPHNSKDPPANTLASTSRMYPLVPKPPGEVSRIKRGGYTLQKVLMWDDEEYKNRQVSPCFTNYFTYSHYLVAVHCTRSGEDYP